MKKSEKWKCERHRGSIIKKLGTGRPWQVYSVKGAESDRDGKSFGSSSVLGNFQRWPTNRAKKLPLLRADGSDFLNYGFTSQTGEFQQPSGGRSQIYVV